MLLNVSAHCKPQCYIVIRELDVIVHPNSFVFLFTGFFALVVSLMAFAGAVYLKYPVQVVHEKFIQLISAGIIFSFVLSLLLYIKARRGLNANLAPGGNSGKKIVFIAAVYVMSDFNKICWKKFN